MCELVKKGGMTAFICGGTVFICGRKDHTCNDKGPIVYTFSEGFHGPLSELCKHENINPNFCEQDCMNLNKIDFKKNKNKPFFEMDWGNCSDICDV